MNSCRTSPSASPTRKLLESLRDAVLLFVSHVPDEILIEHEKKDWKMRPGKMKMRWIDVEHYATGGTLVGFAELLGDRLQ